MKISLKKPNPEPKNQQNFFPLRFERFFKIFLFMNIAVLFYSNFSISAICWDFHSFVSMFGQWKKVNGFAWKKSHYFLKVSLFKWSHFSVGATLTFNLNNTKTYDSELSVSKKNNNNKNNSNQDPKVVQSYVLYVCQQFQSECPLTGKTVSQDNQSALIIRKGRYQFYIHPKFLPKDCLNCLWTVSIKVPSDW